MILVNAGFGLGFARGCHDRAELYNGIVSLSQLRLLHTF